MKLPMRPVISPKGTTTTVKSPTSWIGRPVLRANRMMAVTTPIRPPWKDMPPSHIRSSTSGSANQPLKL